MLIFARSLEVVQHPRIHVQSWPIHSLHSCLSLSLRSSRSLCHSRSRRCGLLLSLSLGQRQISVLVFHFCGAASWGLVVYWFGNIFIFALYVRDSSVLVVVASWSLWQLIAAVVPLLLLLAVQTALHWPVKRLLGLFNCHFFTFVFLFSLCLSTCLALNKICYGTVVWSRLKVKFDCELTDIEFLNFTLRGSKFVHTWGI